MQPRRPLATSVVLLVLMGAGCGVDENGHGTDLSSMDLFGIDINYGDNGPVQDGIGPTDSANTPETFVPAGKEYPSAELLLKITGPSGNGYGISSGSIISVTGVVFSRPNTNLILTWRSDQVTPGGPVNIGSGSATGAPFWQTDPISLVPGDNLVTVTAQSDNETESETIMITYNPAFMFQSRLQVRPPAIFVNDNQKVFSTIALGLYGNLVGSTLALQQVDSKGRKIKDLGAMADNGSTGSSGDEIEKDGVFTLQFNMTCPSADPIYLRAVAQVTGAYGSQESAYSPVVKIDCVNRLPVQTCGLHVKTLSNARSAYEAAKGQGIGPARQAAIDAFNADPDALEVGSMAEEGGLWVMWKDGVLGALNLAGPDIRGGSGDDEAGDETLSTIEAPLVSDLPILSKNTMMLSPFNAEFGANDETQFVGSIAGKMVCPTYNLKGPYNSAAANLSRFRAMSDNGIVAVATHGEVYFKGLTPAARERLGWTHQGAQEVLWSGEAVDCGKLTQSTKTCTSSSQCPAGTQCLITQAVYTGGTAQVSGVCYDATQVDLMSGRAVLGDKTYGITPAFVLNYATARPFPQSIVYLGACRTLYNGSLAASFFAGGAKTVTGYSNNVTTSFASQMGSQFFARMIEQQMKAGEAYGVGAEDPANKGSFFRLFGARDLDVSQSQILNPSFETGDLTAWDQDGDGRVIAKLGPAGPVSGKFMSIISTGLGFTVQTGSIEQTFCVPADATEFSFFWKYYSEEFHEWCGSAYQDTFTAVLVASNGKEYPVVDLSVDDLCAPADCFTCGSKYVGLTPAPIQFDQGDNYQTEWQRSSFNVTSLAGGPVTLRFFCTDKGDSIYDTAVLVDHVKFE
ncbi:MAG: hypothetical protein GXP54_08205 [Deltaproteobacteria bacterium]|nr:hypothetical protein [Deltaproteobacteria bacterium]